MSGAGQLVEVELRSTDPSAVAAVRATIAMLPGGGRLVESDGRFFLLGGDFLAFACERQGYVKRVIRGGAQIRLRCFADDGDDSFDRELDCMIDCGAEGPPCPSGICRLADMAGAVPGGTTDASESGEHFVEPRLIANPPPREE